MQARGRLAFSLLQNMDWSQLSKIAFLGTDRAGLEEISEEELSALKLSKDGDPAELLLKAATLFRARNRAGEALPRLKFAGFLQNKASDKTISSKAALFLEHMLEGKHQSVLPEFLNLCIDTEQKIPTYLGVDLMRCVEQKEIDWGSLKKTLPENALALLQQHPEWKAWAAEPGPELWQSDRVADRALYLGFLRAINPPEALTRLKERWLLESSPAKKQFLDILEDQLSKEDEPFLEACLDEEDLSTRKKAADLLLKIPDASLSVRLFEYIFQFIEEAADGSLIIHLPDQQDPFWARLGLQEKKERHAFRDQPSFWLGQLIEKLHPSYWNTYMNLPPEDCLPMMEASENAVLVLRGVVLSSLGHQEQEWIDAIFGRMFSKNGRYGTLYSKVLQYVSAPVFNKLLSRKLKNQAFLIEEGSPVFEALVVGDHFWSDELALAVLLPFQQWMASARSSQWQTWHYKQLLTKAAYHINPNLVNRLASGWQFQSYLGIQWQEDIEKLNKTLTFRKGMRKAILETSKKKRP
jgi:hypothetical protein